MRKVRVNLGKNSYDILIRSDLLQEAGRRTANILPWAKKAFVLSDSNVAPIYGELLLESLRKAGFTAEMMVIEAGERSKNLQVLGNVFESMAAMELTRSDVLLTLGGGVTGDLGGFAAATFMRGIPFVQIPTSLLAQIDSSVGGKVAVDLQAGKNLAGAFYQPKAVFIDTALLRTLPERFLCDGLAEAVKYGCIKNRELFDRLNSYGTADDVLADADNLVAECCGIKARIVEQDEFDTGTRMLLNFGHTIGHAVERYFDYSSFTHGEGVAVGMYMITVASEAKGLTVPGSAAAIREILEKYELPTAVSIPREDLLRAMARDKKKQGESINLVLLDFIGRAVLRKVSWQELSSYLGESHG